ncbi:MAG TPA: 6-phosphogluconolactonase [Solirubrobacterales bacterium]|nr:6-phosphogluconolactonase [Solirubrobacterales bacterium]
MAIETKILPDADAASRFAAEMIAAVGREAVAARGEFALALSGGKTPWAMIGLLGDMDEMPWDQTHVYQVDERVAPPGDPVRNLTHLVQMLSIPHQSTLRPMPVTSRDLELSAAEYEVHLPEQLDLVHLGLGPDGHTASLVPGDTVLEVDDRRVAMTEDHYQGHRRMTLTYPALVAARQILWLTLGEEVRDPLAKLLAGDTSIPAGRVENDHMLLVADEAAANSASTSQTR